MHLCPKNRTLIWLLAGLGWALLSHHCLSATSTTDGQHSVTDLQKALSDFEAPATKPKPSPPSSSPPTVAASDNQKSSDTATKGTNSSPNPSDLSAPSNASTADPSWANIPAASSKRHWLYSLGAKLAFWPWYVLSQLFSVVDLCFWLIGALYAYSSWIGAIFNIFLFYGFYLAVMKAVYGPAKFKEIWLGSTKASSDSRQQSLSADSQQHPNPTSGAPLIGQPMAPPLPLHTAPPTDLVGNSQSSQKAAKQEIENFADRI